MIEVCTWWLCVNSPKGFNVEYPYSSYSTRQTSSTLLVEYNTNGIIFVASLYGYCTYIVHIGLRGVYLVHS